MRPRPTAGRLVTWCHAPNQKAQHRHTILRLWMLYWFSVKNMPICCYCRYVLSRLMSSRETIWWHPSRGIGTTDISTVIASYVFQPTLAPTTGSIVWSRNNGWAFVTVSDHCLNVTSSSPLYGLGRSFVLNQSYAPILCRVTPLARGECFVWSDMGSTSVPWPSAYK